MAVSFHTLMLAVLAFKYEGIWYYFDLSGYWAGGWRFLDGKWYWLEPGTGRMEAND